MESRVFSSKRPRTFEGIFVANNQRSLDHMKEVWKKWLQHGFAMFSLLRTVRGVPVVLSLLL